MLKSMTAYSRSILVAPLGRFVLELHSVNRKFLEINSFLPRVLLRFDGDIKKWIAEKVQRGQVNVRLTAVFSQGALPAVVPNLALAAQVKGAWEKIAAHVGADAQPFPLALLAEEEGMLMHDEEITDEEPIRKALQALVADALERLLQMKACEGLSLYRDIAARLAFLKGAIERIAEKAPGAVEKYREKLFLKLREAATALAIAEDDERLVKEVCLFADKVDIAEEITRFQSHLEQFHTIMEGSGQGVGKTLEFLLQELNREINTISSKSADVEIARLVIEVKGELERIREQIQNVE